MQDLGTWFLLKITAAKSVQHLEIQFPQDKKHILASHKNGIPTAILHTVLKER